MQATSARFALSESCNKRFTLNWHLPQQDAAPVSSRTASTVVAPISIEDSMVAEFTLLQTHIIINFMLFKFSNLDVNNND
jgi:hypothetical protein